jgi:aldehyde dehydrogenase (NAD+)
MAEVSKLFIDGKWVASSSGRTFDSLNPATEEPVGRFQAGNAKDVDSAVKAAHRAFKAWRLVPAPKRAEALFNARDIIKKNKEKLARLVSMEMGKQLPEGRGDVQEAIDTFEYFAGEGRRLFGRTTTSELPNKFAMTTRMPVGVCGLITPWNFPIAIPAWKLAPALICGNAVIFKPSSDTPLCATELVKILEEAGVPPGVVNLVTGSARDVGEPLVKHPGVQGVSFTGHKDTGLWIQQNAGHKRVGMEMGGKNPIIVMEDADVDLAVEGVVWGGFGTTGQRCTACSRVIVEKAVHGDFVDKFAKRTRKLKVGDVLKGNEVGPLVNKAAQEKTARYVDVGRKEGAVLVEGGEKIPGKGFFFKPTIFDEVRPSMTIAQEEIFGPVVSVLPVKDLESAISVANGVEYGLSTSIYTRDINRAMVAIRDLEAGITYVNASTIGAEVHLPFGGVKSTGNGTREAGWTGIEEFSEEKAVYIDYSGRLQRAQIDVDKPK